MPPPPDAHSWRWLFVMRAEFDVPLARTCPWGGLVRNANSFYHLPDVPRMVPRVDTSSCSYTVVVPHVKIVLYKLPVSLVILTYSVGRVYSTASAGAPRGRGGARRPSRTPSPRRTVPARTCDTVDPNLEPEHGRSRHRRRAAPTSPPRPTEGGMCGPLVSPGYRTRQHPPGFL